MRETAIEKIRRAIAFRMFLNACSTSREKGVEMEKQSSRDFNRKKDWKITLVLTILLFLPTLCMLTGVLFFVVTLNLLDFFNVKIHSVGFRVINYELLLFKKSNPPAFSQKTSQEIH
jgi:hypothetical protein